MKVFGLFKAAAIGWWNDDVPRLGASLAYYTLFAIAPILLLAIAIAGVAFGADAVRGQVVGQIQGMVGKDAATAVQALLQGANKDRANVLASVIGIVTFLIAASSAFLELQFAFNRVWAVTPDPKANVETFVINRLRAFGLVLAIGFLLLVSLAVSAGLAAFGGWMGTRAPASPLVWELINIAVSLLVVTSLFALLYKFLPDVELSWRDVWVGSAVTALLFTIGKELIGLYLGRGSVASSYGAAGSVVVLLLWVYYASQIVLFGAEFVRVDAEQRLGHPVPVRRLGKRAKE